MVELKFDSQYNGEGISKGLQRGIIPFVDGKQIVEEGMGIGSFAVQYHNRTYFCTSRVLTQKNDRLRTIKVEYQIDRELVWMIFGMKSKLLTVFLEKIATDVYMKNEKIQGILLNIGTYFRSISRAKIEFVNIPSKGSIDALYNILNEEIIVTVSGETKIKDYKLFVMNEVSGELFSQAYIEKNYVSPPTGWQKIENSKTNFQRYYLSSPKLDISFYMEEIQVPKNINSKLFWGREVSNGYNWAGFESEILCESEKFNGYKYKVCFIKNLEGAKTWAK